AIRTARKRRCVVSVASQDPEDFTKNPDLRAIRSNCQIKIIFNLPNLKLAQRELGFSDGQAAELGRMIKSGGQKTRDCMVFYPDGDRTGCVHLRIALDPVSAYLCAGAGIQTVSKNEALKALESVMGGERIHPNLLRALETDALIEERQPIYSAR